VGGISSAQRKTTRGERRDRLRLARALRPLVVLAKGVLDEKTVRSRHRWMARLIDLARTVALLENDRHWSAYAIGDLDPALAHHCSWHGADGSDALVLLYRGFDPPILFAMGRTVDVANVLREIDVPQVSLHVQSEGLAALAPRFRVSHLREMWRMVVEPDAFRGTPTDDVVMLDESDVAAVLALYEDGHRHGEGPTFFHASMLQQGSFRGIREGGDLIAIAGTHLFSPDLGVCAIGNVYTRRDRRRRGLAARVTSAVVEHAIAHQVATIVLNVTQTNEAARRVYEQLGFRRYCAFFEGEADQVVSVEG
jgi:ribosomal protein S18 acetylase RimI-like enzyme